MALQRQYERDAGFGSVNAGACGWLWKSRSQVSAELDFDEKESRMEIFARLKIKTIRPRLSAVKVEEKKSVNQRVNQPKELLVLIQTFHIIQNLILQQRVLLRRKVKE